MTKVLVNLLQTTGTKGGIEIYAKELYKALAQIEHEFEFVGLASKELSQIGADWFPGELIFTNISGENRVSWALGETFAVSSAAKRCGADLIHGPAMFAPPFGRIPSVVSLHDVLYFSHPELMQNKLFTEPVKVMELLGARKARRVITISEYSARGIEKFLKIPSSKIDVIPLAGRINPGTTVNTGSLRDGAFLAVGQRSPYKNLETVVRAWSEIPEANRPKLVVTGSHGEDPLRPIVERLKLERWVILKSWVTTEELAELFNSAPAIIDSTLATGFSMPTIEAMAAGLPVILADTEIFREVGGTAAEYFEAGNPADLARVVGQLCEQPTRLNVMREQGLLRAQNYSWEKVAMSTLNTFRESLS